MHTNTITSEVLPGLGLRTRLALARVQKQIDPDSARVAMRAIWDETRTAGYRAFEAKQYWPSTLIAEDHFLCAAWRKGPDAANWDSDWPIPF